jgi:hypothetical protein
LHESLERRDSLRPPADRLAGFREANDRIAASAKEGVAIFVCECGSADCFSTIALNVAVYEKIRSSPAWALVVRGHELEDGERVAAEGASFVVVERPYARDTDNDT